MSKPLLHKYKTTNWKSYTQALRARGCLTVWLDTQMQWQAPSSGKPGRPAVYSDAAVQCCLRMKVLFGLALRQTQGFVHSVLKLSGLDWKAPDYSTINRRQQRLTVEITARPSQGGLHLLVDSTGIKMLGEGEWKTKKHGAEYRRQWRKVHLGIDAQVTDSTYGPRQRTGARGSPERTHSRASSSANASRSTTRSSKPCSGDFLRRSSGTSGNRESTIC
jgi:hypothetical protein